MPIQKNRVLIGDRSFPMVAFDQNGKRYNVPLVDDTNRLVGQDGRELRRSDAGPVGMWWPVKGAGTADTQIVDRGSQLPLVIQGGGTPLATQTPSTFLFSGSNYMQIPVTGPKALLSMILNLATLTTEDMIVFWCLCTHPATIATKGQLFFYGRSGSQGWGVGINNALLRTTFDQTPNGGSGLDSTIMDTPFKWQGDGANNTRTAFCCTITRAPVDLGNYGAGFGLFEIQASQFSLGTASPFGQQNYTLGFARRVPSGTAPASFTSDAYLTIGARPSSSYATVLDVMPSGVGIDNIGFQRRKRVSGFPIQVTRDLAVNNYAHPQSAAV